ncbi:hypothetical protein [Kushneria aurantia]|uniref:Uncharacterized protein n=1 Tax=Kushneria aurantia TaxID=504092 RepID=A0ABV6G2E1_9GAMM|nr:hypothetical protein [Kushneria aurantia]
MSAIPALYPRYGPSAFETYIPAQLKAPLGLLRIREWLATALKRRICIHSEEVDFSHPAASATAWVISRMVTRLSVRG